MDNNGNSPLTAFSNCPHVVDSIYQLLSFQDVLNLSSVNKYHRELIFNSPAFLDKVVLVVYNTNSEGFKSSRFEKFKKVKLCGGTKKINDRDLSISNQGQIQVLQGRVFDWEFEIIEQLKDIEELTFQDITPVVKRSFPSFKKLTFINGHPSLLMSQLKNNQLKSLSITNDVYIKNALKFFVEVRVTAYKLEELFLSDHSRYNFDQDKPELQEFLHIHRDSLKVVTLDMWITRGGFVEVFQMPNLTHLTLFELAKANRSVEWNHLDFPISQSLRFLHLQDLKDNNQLLEAVLKSCPNITELKVHKLNNEARTIIATHAKKLKVLTSEVEEDQPTN